MVFLASYNKNIYGYFSCHLQKYILVGSSNDAQKPLSVALLAIYKKPFSVVLIAISNKDISWFFLQIIFFLVLFLAFYKRIFGGSSCNLQANIFGGPSCNLQNNIFDGFS